MEYNDGTDDYSLDIRVDQSSDDAEEASDGSMNVRSEDLELTEDRSDTQKVGIRFRDVDIPNAATITNAYIEFIIDQTGSDTTNLTIAGQASDNAPTFASGRRSDDDISDRTLTTATVAWSNVPAWEGLTKKQRIEIGKTAIGNLVLDRDIAWGFGSWTDSDRNGYTSGINYTKIHEGCEQYSSAHQLALQNAIASVSPLSRTPFTDSLIAARKYFAKEKADLNGDLYVESGCDQLFLIDVTDGLGNTGTTPGKRG